MTAYLERMGHKFSLFDAPLVYNFSQTSRTEKADLTKIFDGTLVKSVPVNAVVCNVFPNDDTSRRSRPMLPLSVD